MAGLNFYLLGPPYITWNDTVLDIPRRQVRGLLYYLATYPSAIPQERLHFLFWDDQSEIKCRRNLSHLLTHVRKVLPESEILLVKNSLIMLDTEKVFSDAIEFNRLLQTSRENNQQQALQQAADLYRGPYLDGIQLPGGREFENLVERERFGFERKYLNVLYKLILIKKRQKEYETAVEYAFRYLAVDNLSEEVHRQLIALYGLTGKRERAVEQFNICENLLKQELQISPSEKTRAVLENVLSDSLPERETTNREYPTTIRPVRNNPTFISKEYLAQLDALVSAEERGPWGIALLRGEMGIGKSSLLDKYLESFRNEKLVLSKKCNPGSRSIRYWPIKQICLAASKPEHDALKNKLGIFEEVEDCLQRFSNDLLFPDSENSTDTLSRDRNFSVLLKTIYHLAEAAGGLILCIENLEWADENSLDFILYLCNHLREKNILILGSYCCEENENIRKFFHSVQVADDFLGIMNLQGIDVDTTLSLLKYWLGDFQEAQVLAEKLHGISSGNPLFLTELLRWVVEAGLSVQDLVDNQTFPIPTSISNVVDFRLSRLNQAERKVIDAIAVMAYSFEMERILVQTGLPVQQVLDALDELVNRHFLETQSATYRFRNELIRQSVLEAMSPARRQVFAQGYVLEQS